MNPRTQLDDEIYKHVSPEVDRRVWSEFPHPAHQQLKIQVCTQILDDIDEQQYYKELC
jgi:hypothetical protein